uniref:probable tRNA (uracil-O(2)-)-methyltransferase n=1 Tax=Myxine glutinosa TaxID=7769 RepID=UPI00358FE819
MEEIDEMDMVEYQRWEKLGACCLWIQGHIKPPEELWQAVGVWVNRPHVLNHRLCGCVIIAKGAVADRAALKCWLADERNLTLSVEDVGFILAALSPEESNTKDKNMDESFSLPMFEVIVRTLLPKDANRFSRSLELIIKDFPNSTCYSFAVLPDKSGVPRPSPGCVYAVGCTADDNIWCLTLWLLDSHDWKANGVGVPSVPWLLDRLLPQLCKWMVQAHKGENRQRREFPESLSLLPIEKYALLYQELKMKYKQLVKVWPEVTDPEKFVFEDVAIATYLMVLWAGDSTTTSRENRRECFVDLGCGNGLLVHILTREGYPGRGIDLRKRKIWDMYGADTRLEECTITPGDGSLFPEVDWLIGNHSDELTPWIPVIAARSSHSCKYFVLPCCYHDFTGKYIRRQSSNGQYREYLDFVAEVGTVCGFHVEEDTMRIPSTKRVCQIGRRRNYTEDEEKEMEQRRSQYIECRAGSPSSPLYAKKEDSGLTQGTELETHGEQCISKSLELDETALEMATAHLDNGTHIDRLPQDSAFEKPKVIGDRGNRKYLSPLQSEKEDEASNQISTDSSCKEEEKKLNEPNGQPGEITGKQEFNCSWIVQTNHPLPGNASSTCSWAGSFRPREKEERVRNCTRLPAGLTEKVVAKVFEALLVAPKPTNKKQENKEVCEFHPEESWQRGGSLTLGEVANLLDSETLKQLKCEFGGLQTLLRNKHQVFEVLRGVVHMRDWRQHLLDHPVKKARIKRASCDRRKSRPCWFHLHHPQGCPLQTSQCPFAHGDADSQQITHDS